MCSRARTAGRRCASARCNGRRSARRRVCGMPRRRHPRAGARLRHDDAGGDPPELRHAARARRRQRGAADRAAALPDRRLAAAAPAACCCRSSGWFKAARDDAALQRPDLLAGRRPRTINMITIGDDLLRESLARLRPEDRGAGRLQQQPGGGGARERQGRARLPARGPVHRGARTFPDRHRRPCRHRAAGHHPARTLGHARRLRPHLRADQPAGDRAARPGAAEHRDLPRAGGTHGFRRALFRRQRRADRRAGLAAARVDADGTARAAAGSSWRCPRRRLPTAASPPPTAGPGSDRRRPGRCPTTCRTTSAPKRRRRWRRATRWR